jgi:hypothetical protein
MSQNSAHLYKMGGLNDRDEPATAIQSDRIAQSRQFITKELAGNKMAGEIGGKQNGRTNWRETKRRKMVGKIVLKFSTELSYQMTLSDRGSMLRSHFLRFLAIFGEKNWRFSQKPML